MINRNGGCHCGAVRYEVRGEAFKHVLCHCNDCRRHAGAPMVAWSMFPEAALTVIKGSTKIYESSKHGRREFCPHCGTGLFYRCAETLPNIVDIQSSTFDEAENISPVAHMQTAEQMPWVANMASLPQFHRYPPAANVQPVCEKKT
jgi:hypothetical protein